jgi:alkylation response protein AidB-like acyl-CoA dehydrogenase
MDFPYWNSTVDVPQTGVRQLSGEEQAVVATVGAFVDREVRPVVRELEHANTYPEHLIEQMKRSGIFGLAIRNPGATPRSRPPATPWSRPSWPGAG